MSIPYKRLATDILGITLMILSILFGWIPGPGGIPLFLAGLSLLAINHDWAKRWLDTAKSKGLNIGTYIFKDTARWSAGVDLVGTIITALGVWTLLQSQTNWTLAIGLGGLLLGASLLLGNRHRLKRFSRYIKT